MNLEERFDKLTEFLKPYKNIWSKEIIFSYPDYKSPYLDQWPYELKGATQQELWRYDCRDFTGSLKGSSLEKLYEQIDQLTQLSIAPYGADTRDFPSWAFFKVSEKKEHEIRHLAPTIREVFKDQKLDYIIDIGGGQGHLGRTLAHYFHMPVISIDKSEELQELGKKRLNKFPLPKDSKELTFHSTLFHSDNNELKNVFSKKNISLGLHTCGDLAIEHLKAFDQWQGNSMLNFGCCYNRLDPKTDFKISKYVQDNCPFELNSFCMTLATRGHTQISFEDFILKNRVKNFRYALHLLHYHLLGITDFQKFGSAFPRNYRGSFSDYALEKLSSNQIDHSLNQKIIQDFYDDMTTQESINDMFLLNLIRWQFGRCMELLILIDRCLYLKEKGHHPKLWEFFDQSLSPRNIGIYCAKK